VKRRLVASAEDLEQIAASDEAEVPALHGWRREVFGEDALRLKHAKLALTAAGNQIRLVRME
jgi:ribonuclease D